MFVVYSIVTTTEISLPLRWLATIEPTPPSRCYSVLGGLSGCCFPKTAPHYSAVVIYMPLHLMPCECTSIWQHCPPSSSVRLPLHSFYSLSPRLCLHAWASAPSTAKSRPTKTPTVGRHDLTFPRVPTHAALTVVFYATCAPCTVPGCGQKFCYQNQKFEFFGLPFLMHYMPNLKAVSVIGWAELRIPDPEMLKCNSFPRFGGGSVTNTCRDSRAVQALCCT